MPESAAVSSHELLGRLAERDFAPQNIQLTSVGGGFFASVFGDDVHDDAISENVSIGFAQTPELATLKGVVEWLERAAFREGAAANHPGCRTARSDGFAAFPLIGDSGSKAKNSARKHAYGEAVERYVWATWWEDHEIGHERYSESIIPVDGLCSGLLSAAARQVEIDRFEVIVPNSDAAESELAIIIAHLKNGGSLTGGAAGRLDDAGLWERAAAELFRHCLALRRILNGESQAISFYERRILLFGTGEGRGIVADRLNRKGMKQVLLPALAFDDEIPYMQSDLVYVHRCLFDKQPPFIGGQLARLCF